MSLTIGSRFGVFEVQSLLGVGGMGEVYLAHDTRLGRDVALKVIPAAVAADRQRLDRFTREARALAALTHPAIGAIYDVAEHEETRALVLELVEGDTLDQRLQRGPLSIAEALTIARTVAEALDAAHDKGLVHRDLKPGNIKLTPAGDVKILDFGLAKLGEEHGATTSTVAGTIPGAIMGTAAYMSPEQARGQAVDKRADVWAFGCVLYELLSGRAAFRGETWSDTIAQTLTKEPDWSALPSGTPPRIVHLIERCLQKDPKQRLRGLGGVELAFADRMTSAASPRRWPLAFGGVATLALVAVAAWSLSGRPAPADVTAIRFEIPPSVRMAETGSFALSPDGRRLAFAGTGADGRFRLWERSMDSLETRAIGGTEGELAASSTLFWSPDSRFIGFYADGAVRRIDRNGGQVQVVCRVPAIAVGGTWNRRDEIVVGNIAGGLVRCPAGGGDPVVVVEPDEPGGARTGDFFPVFLPDGRRLLYLRISRTDPSVVGLYLADLDRPADAQSKTRLIETGYGAKFAPTSDRHGHILFVRNRGVWAVPFDTRQIVTGEPFMVVESVGTFRDWGFFDTNGRVLVHRGGIPDFQLSWRDRRGGDLGPVGEPGQYKGVALSPDGQRAVVARDNKLNRADHDLWLVDLNRNAMTRFTSDTWAESIPAWASDSQSFVFATGRTDGGDIHQHALDGSPARILLSNRDLKGVRLSPLFTAMSIGAGGDWLAYTVEARGSTRSDIWMLRMLPTSSGATPVIQQEFDQVQPSLAPNGQWLAYVSNESGVDQVLLRPLRIGADGVPEVGGAVVVSRGGGRSPRWRADSKELYFQATDGGVMAAQVAGTIGEPARLFSIQGALSEWGVASNGERFLLAVPAAGHDLPFTVVLNWLSGLK